MSDPDSSSGKLQQYWEERYATFSLDESGCLGAGEALNRTIYRAKTQAVRKALRLAKVDARRPLRVLDMGCGWGYWARFYAAEFPLASYVGVDISSRAIDRARELMPQFAFFAHDIVSWRDAAFPRFDVVQAIDVLQLLLDDAAYEAALANMAAHLDAGGVMFLPLLSSDLHVEGAHHRARPRGYFDALLQRLALEVVHEFPMYYWLIDGGSRNRVLRAIFARTGPEALYLVDRLALMLGLENRDPEQVTSRARMLVIRRRQSAAATGPRSTGSES